MRDLTSKSIALIIPDFDFGGEEKRVVFFANNYLNYFKEVYVIAPGGKSNELLDPRVKHLRLKVRGYKSIPHVIKFIKDNQIDFLQGHKRAVLPYLLATEKLTASKSIFNFDNIYLNQNKLFSYLSPKYLLFLSDVLKDFYSEFYPKRDLRTVNMGGDFFNTRNENEIAAIKKELGIGNQYVILSLGRLSEQKNQRLLLDALNKLSDQDFICLIAGSGPLEDELKMAVEKYNLSGKVRFLGHRTDIENLLNISDVLVQSSIFEGFPNVFIEAVSVGLPIISTDVGSSSTLIKKNGLLTRSNDVDGLVKAILDLMANQSKFKNEAMELKESDFFKQFHKSEMLKSYVKFYLSL